MSNTFYYIANSGRSGSTYLFNFLRSLNCQNTHYIAHEDIPIQITKPRYYNRSYDIIELKKCLKDKQLADYLSFWETTLENRSIVETGWTCYHLLPVLHHLFAPNFKLVILHRNPWSVALSRASMGNYHKRTWYDNAHEVSPFDQKTIAPNFASSWKGMNHVEKCFFWWYVCYREIIEYTEIFPDTPKLFLSFDAFFIDKLKCNEMLNFLNMDSQKCLNPKVHERNSRHRFMRETFPIHLEWKSLLNHKEIIDFAEENFGYTITNEELQEIARKYYLPEGLMPLLRHKTRFWERRRRVGHQIKRLFQPQI